MLQSLYIQNYALIEELRIDFYKGFSTITGETGAGKSILLGAFSLLLGSRADSSVLLDKTKKCVVEASFNIKSYRLKDFFNQNDIDYNETTIIRREVHDNSRSRAFVNDSPVNLSILKELGDRLIDVHSQHENLYLNHARFRFEIIDSLSGNASLLEKYSISYRSFIDKSKELQELSDKAAKSKSDFDYLKYRYEELEKVSLKAGEMSLLEAEAQALSHSEEIRSSLQGTAFLLSGDELSINSKTKQTLSLLAKIREYYPKAALLSERIETAYVELKDIAVEADALSEQVEVEPGRLEKVNERLDLLYSLCQKYRVAKDDELIVERDKLSTQLMEITSSDETLETLRLALEKTKKELTTLSLELSASRKKAGPIFEEKIISLLKNLGMPNALFTVKIDVAEDFGPYGKDTLAFLFSANKQVAPSDIAKVASGGELSRLMLSIKSVVSSSLALPGIIFDEIDTGVSGEIADKMANIMLSMSVNMQVISITHLPQVAAKGAVHYWVYKTDDKEKTNTHIKQLNKEERIREIAKMLSGEKISDIALENARVLLKG